MTFHEIVRIPVQWGDMDALGHVNNTVFFRWMESARIACFGRMGLRAAHSPAGVGPILATITCDYLVPVVFPGEVAVGLRVSRIGTTSIAMDYTLWRGDAAGGPASPCARGTSVIVTIDYRSGAKVPVPEAIRAAIADLPDLAA